MIRKLTLVLAGALIGASTAFVVTTGVPLPGAANAAGASTYRQLSIFGDIFERVRSQYVTEPED
ncbi:MAG: peptidase S41, partial [Parvibaculum sp.]